MWYMEIVIFEGAFNDRYRNSATELPSVCKILFSTLRKAIESFLQLFSSAVKHPYNLLPFWRDTVIMFILQESEKVLMPPSSIV